MADAPNLHGERLSKHENKLATKFIVAFFDDELTVPIIYM